jgi:8-oxo-dGTP pyrophosphatase MutT (NUDIX family)
MYEVFFNDRKITITTPGKITISKTLINTDSFTSPKAFRKWFLEFEKKDVNDICLVHKSPDYFFIDILKPAFRVIQAAGGVVKRDENLLFIFRNDKWDLPKGKIDKGETKQKAAIREVQEECGIIGHKIVESLPSTFHIYQSPYADTKGEWVLKETFWFEMEYRGTENGVPQKEENITEIKWFEIKELELALSKTYANLVPIINYYRG